MVGDHERPAQSRVLKLIFEDSTVRFISSKAPALESVGPQKCLAFSIDGAKFAIGGEDGHLRIFHWLVLIRSILVKQRSALKI